VPKFYCGYCKADLQRIPEGEWVDSEGYIFCSVTDEVHYRTLKEATA
jgi:hypothetical protein